MGKTIFALSRKRFDLFRTLPAQRNNDNDLPYVYTNLKQKMFNNHKDIAFIFGVDIEQEKH